MHYYTHHIADYRKDTGHLSLLEHGIYRQLLDTYYLQESPLTTDKNHLMRSHSVRNAEEMRAFENVLDDFFELTDKGYIHSRCKHEIERIHAKSDKARQSAIARWSTNKSKRNANALRTDSEGNANGMLPNNPIPNNPIKEKSNKKETGAGRNVKDHDFSKWPSPPSDNVLDDYKKTRKARLTQTAIDRMASEIHKAVNAGLTPDDCLSVCCEAGWQGFKYDWYLNREKKNGNSGQNSEGLTGAAKRASDFHDDLKRYAEGGAAAVLDRKNIR